MSKSFDRVVDAFHNAGLIVKTTGRAKASAQAPGHSAVDRSVTITGIQGKVLVWSHSDPTENVLDALGLSDVDLFDDPKGITYNYPDGRRVLRSPNKRFSQSGNTKGQSLYRAEKLKDAGTVAFVEGEQDVHALESMGVVATCTAMGAGKAHLFDLTPLHGKTVRIIRDMDEPGMNHAQQVARLLAGKAIVEVYEPRSGNDAADHIAAGHGILDFIQITLPEPVEPVDAEMEDAIEGERRYLYIKAEALRRLRQEVSEKLSVPVQVKTLREIQGLEFEYDWVIPGLLEKSDRLILTGIEGGGKSYFLRQVAIMAAAGLSPFSQEPIRPVNVLVIDAENSERQWARTTKYITGIAERAGARPPQDHVKVSAGFRVDLGVPADVEQIHRLIDKHEPSILMIGPLYKLVSGEITNDDDAAPLIKTLDAFRERGIALLMEAHTGHAGKSSKDLRPRGSSALLGWPEFGFGLLPDTDNEEFVDLVRWRGDREQREWPSGFRKGMPGELPWMPQQGFDR